MQEREFYKDYFYPKPNEQSVRASGRGKAKAGAGGKKYAVVIIIIFALIAVLLLSDYLSNGLAIGLFKKNSDNISVKAADYYAAETGAFTSMRQAADCAEETAAAGGAGYIYNDGTFHVLASVHTKYADADAAAKTYEPADVFTLKIPNKTITYTGNKSEKEAARKALALPPSVFSQISDMSSHMKSGGLSAAQCFEKLQTLETDIQTALDGLNAASTEAPMPVIRLKAELTAIINILSDTAGSEASNAELRRRLDYNAIKIICAYKDMVTEI